MNIESIWMIIVALSAPIVGVVAFYIQLKNLKSINLKNEKLIIEIVQLKKENHKLEGQIKMPTIEEVERYGRQGIPLFSRGCPDSAKNVSVITRLLNIDWAIFFLTILAVSFIGYLSYDIYRIGLWLINWL